MTPTSTQLPYVLSVEPFGGGVVVEATIPAKPGWKSRLTLDLATDVPRVVECCVVPHDAEQVPIEGVRTSTLRSVHVAAVVRAAFSRTDERSIGWLIDRFQGVGTSERIVDSFDPGPRKRDERFFAGVAIDWERLTAAGPGARRRLAEERHHSEATVANWVREATRLGMLDRPQRTGPGQRFATARARELAQ